MSQGYIYFFRSEGRDIYKIGQTSRHPDIRLKELNGRQAADPVISVYYAVVDDPVAAEKYFHQKFTDYDHHNEWFKMPEHVANRVVKEFKNYQLGSFHGAGERSKPKKKGKSVGAGRRGPRRKSQSPWASVLILSGVVLVLTQWSRLPAIASCVSTLDFNKCAKIL